MKRKIFLFVSIVVMLISVAFTNNTDQFELSKNLDVFASLYRELNTRYVDETDPGKLMKTGIDAMLESLDPYTNYYPESKIEDYKFMQTGQYGGIGSTVHKIGDYCVISEPYEGFPAYKAGLRAGDKVLEINAVSAKGKNVSDLSKILKGEPGSKVKLKIERQGKEMDFEITREEIQVKSVPYYAMLDKGIGYIKLSSFTEKAGKEVKEALQDLQKSNELKGLIFDLRGNPGGLLRESIDIVNYFVDKGTTVVETKGKYKNTSEVRKTLNSPIDTRLPLTVLVDGGSASASEIVSGSLQDLDRAVIIGQKTYGKGLVQGTYNLSYNAMLKVTIAKYYTPSGRCIQKIDYGHRDDKGKAIKIADSLKTTFRTKNGREVIDGDGIRPDIEIEKEKGNPVLGALIEKNHIFNFATDYRASHESLIAAKEFKVSDQLFNEFVNYLKDKDYSYTTASDKILNEFKKTAENEKYIEAVKDEYEALHKKLQAQKNSDLLLFKEEIKQMLKEEIASRYYYQKGRAEAGLSNDKYIEKAIEILLAQEKYNSLLNPSGK
ncbi:MAG: S41 family peptidase [Flavobacteriales bacterium]